MKFSKWFGGYLSLENIFSIGKGWTFSELHVTKLFETFLEQKAGKHLWGCARSTSGSLNWAVLPMLKLLWPLVVVNLKIRGLIWRGIAYFVQITQLFFLPGDIRRTMTSKLPCRRRRFIFGFKLEAWWPKHVSYFFFFLIWCGFRNCKSFLWVVNAISSEKSPWFQCLSF